MLHVDRVSEPNAANETLQSVVSVLLRAYNYARDLNQSPWFFAILVEDLAAIQVSSAELQSLLEKGLICCASVSSKGGQRRILKRVNVAQKNVGVILTFNGAKFASHMLNKGRTPRKKLSLV